MTWTVDSPIRAGGLACVPIVEATVSVHGSPGRIAGYGKKRPAIILVFRAEGVTGIDMDGRVHDASAIEQRFPNAIAKAVGRMEADGD